MSGTRSRAVRVLAAVALAVSLTANGWLVLEHREAAALERARDEALAQGTETVLALTSYDADTLDQDFAAVLDGSVDPFRSQFEAAGEHLRKVIERHDGRAVSELVRAGVGEATEDRVELVLLVDQVVESDRQRRPRTDRNRIAVTMVRTDAGDWRVSEAALL